MHRRVWRSLPITMGQFPVPNWARRNVAKTHQYFQRQKLFARRWVILYSPALAGQHTLELRTGEADMASYHPGRAPKVIVEASRPVLEPLESRTLLSASLDNGVLNIIGAD